MKILRDRIIWNQDDFIEGVVPIFQNNTPKVLGKGAAFMRDFDPFRADLVGAAYPGFSGTDATNNSVVDSVLVSSVVTPDGLLAYLIGGTKFQELTIVNDTLTSPVPHTLAAAGVHGAHSGFSFALGDINAYNIGTATRYLYSWNDGTDWDVGMYNGSAFDDDFMSSVPATPLGTTAADLTDGVGHPHPLYRSAADDLEYIGSGRYVHVFDGGTGASGTFSSRVLTLPVGSEAVGFAETGYDFVVFHCNNARSGRRGVAQAYFWGATRSGDPEKTLYLDDDEVAAPFNYLGTIGCFTKNRNSNRCVLRLYDGLRFIPKFFYTGSLPVIGGVEIQDNLVKWNAAGVQYSWGARDGMFPEATFQNFTSGGTSSGLLKSFISGTLYMSSGTTNVGGLQIFSGNFGAQSFWQGLTATPDFPAGKMGRVKEVKVTFANIASAGRSLALQLKSNFEQTTTTVFTGVDTVTSANMIRSYRFNSSGAPLPKFESLKPNLIWSTGSGATSAPGIKQIEVIFEPISIFT